MNCITDNVLILKTEIDTCLAAAGDNADLSAALLCAIDDADKALQSEFIGYPDTDAAEPLRDAYFNVQRVLPHLWHTEPLPEYAEHGEGYVAYRAEVERLFEVVKGRLAMSPVARA